MTSFSSFCKSPSSSSFIVFSFPSSPLDSDGLFSSFLSSLSSLSSFLSLFLSLSLLLEPWRSSLCRRDLDLDLDLRDLDFERDFLRDLDLKNIKTIIKLEFHDLNIFVIISTNIYFYLHWECYLKLIKKKFSLQLIISKLTLHRDSIWPVEMSNYFHILYKIKNKYICI